METWVIELMDECCSADGRVCSWGGDGEGLIFWLRVPLSSSLLLRRQRWGDSSWPDLRPHPGLPHTLHQKGAHHRAPLRVPAGLPGLPDGRAPVVVCHPFVSSACTRTQTKPYKALGIRALAARRKIK